MAAKNQFNDYSCVKQTFNSSIKAFNDELGAEAEKYKSLFKITNRDVKQRISATVYLITICKKIFKDQYDDIFLVEYVAKLCSALLPTDSICLHEYNTSFAFAIWYLDELEKVGKVDEIYEIVPYKYADSNVPIIDSLHSDELIERVAYVCENADFETREEFNKLLNLLNEYSPEAYKRASDKFLDEIIRLLALYLKQIKRLADKCNKIDNETRNMLQTKPSALFVNEAIYGFSIEDAKELVHELEKTSESMAKLFTGLGSAGSLNKNAAREFFSFAYCDELAEYQIDNPFEICAIYHISKFKQTELYWCFGPVASLYMLAARRLPWCGALSSPQTMGTQYLDSPYQYEMKYDSNLFDTSKDKKSLINEAQLFFTVSGGVLPPRIEKAYNSTKLILENNGLSGNSLDVFMSKLRHLSPLGYSSDFSDGEEDATIEDDENDFEEEILEKLEEKDNQDNSTNDLLTEVRLLKEKNKDLSNEVYIHESRVRRLEKELMIQKSSLDILQCELADLRSVVFNSQNGDYDKELCETLPIIYPYTTRKNIVVFGGHESWSKAIKPRFTNVKFIHKDSIPNAEQIKSSNVVWIQTNALAHANFYKIIDVARVHGVPVRYFSYASAIKCAEQIVIDDME